jgi:BirA family biotin operon repressor/biotin-[acetyl-CoA-carboxylase] ligase
MRTEAIGGIDIIFLFVNYVFIVVNKKPECSTKARLLMELREKRGRPLSGGALARTLGISRVAVWKGIQALVVAGYTVTTLKTGYLLDSEGKDDFLYPWEFGGKETLFRHFESTDSTMDRARELAVRGATGGTVITAEKQTAGRGRNGRTWSSRRGGLFFTILERPRLALADYTLFSLVLQIAVARALSSICGKQVRLRWPNDVYLGEQKIAGIMTEVSGEADLVSWLTGGVGVNVNNPVPSGKTTSCAEILGRPVFRGDVLRKILKEVELVKKRFKSGAAYSQDGRALATEWNSLADRVGAKAVVIAPGYGKKKETVLRNDSGNRLLARGVFAGIDPAGRCVIRSESGKGTLYFNPGPVSLFFYA